MLNDLIYGNIKSKSEGGNEIPGPPSLHGFEIVDIGEDDDFVSNELLRTNSGRLIYSEGYGVVLWTWWDFSQNGEENSRPLAYINGKKVCGGHTTGHIIAYEIEKDNIFGGKASVTIYVNMTMGPRGTEDDDWNGGAACIHRIWGGSEGGKNGYYNADPDHRCEKSGTCGGGATFKVVFDTNAGTYKIY